MVPCRLLLPGTDNLSLINQSQIPATPGLTPNSAGHVTIPEIAAVRQSRLPDDSGGRGETLGYFLFRSHSITGSCGKEEPRAPTPGCAEPSGKIEVPGAQVPLDEARSVKPIELRKYY